MKLARVASVVAVVLVGLVAFGLYAFAQSDKHAAPWERGHWAHGEGGWHDRGPDPERIRELRADVAADLAAELGRSAADVEAAFRTVLAQRLQDAVEGGDMDQMQAEEAMAAYEEGDVRGLVHLLKR